MKLLKNVVLGTLLLGVAHVLCADNDQPHVVQQAAASSLFIDRLPTIADLLTATIAYLPLVMPQLLADSAGNSYVAHASVSRLLYAGMLSFYLGFRHSIPVVGTSLPITTAMVLPSLSSQVLQDPYVRILTVGAYLASNAGYFTKEFGAKWMHAFNRFFTQFDLVPFSQRIYVKNKTNHPLELLADTPCEGNEGMLWCMKYDIEATDAIRLVLLSAWRQEYRTGAQFKQEKICFPRLGFPTDRRMMPYPVVHNIRFVSKDCELNTDTEAICRLDSCLLPIYPMYTLPVYIVEYEGDKLVVNLRYYAIEEIKDMFKTQRPSIAQLIGYSARGVDYLLSSAISMYLDSTVTKERVYPIRSCK